MQQTHSFYFYRNVDNSILAFSLLYEETGPGAFAGEGSYSNHVEGINVAKECLLAAVKAEPKSAQLWVNLANAYYLAAEHTNAKSCLEQVCNIYLILHFPFC